MSTATPSHVPASGPSIDGPCAPQHEPASSGKVHYKVGRHPKGTLKNNPALKAQVNRLNQVRIRQMIKDGELIDKRRRDGSKYTISSLEEYQARTRSSARRYRRRKTEENRAKVYQQKNESARRVRAKRKAQREAEREGRIWQGSPIRQGRPRQYWDQAQPAAEEGGRQVPADTRMEGGTQHAVDVPHAPPTMLSPRLPESSSSFWPVLDPLHGALHHRFGPGASSLKLDLDLSLSTPGSISGQREATHAPQAAPPAATREEDKLRLTLAQPRHD